MSQNGLSQNGYGSFGQGMMMIMMMVVVLDDLPRQRALVGLSQGPKSDIKQAMKLGVGTSRMVVPLQSLNKVRLGDEKVDSRLEAHHWRTPLIW